MWLTDSILAHPTSWALGAAYFITGAISTMPKPGMDKPKGAIMYEWLYDFLHVISNRLVQRWPQTMPAPPVVPVTTSAPPVVSSAIPNGPQ